MAAHLPDGPASGAGYVAQTDSDGFLHDYVIAGALSSEELTVTGDVTSGVRYVKLNHATVAIVATMLDTIGDGERLVVYNTSASGTEAHTLTLAGSQTWNGTDQTATLDAPDEALEVIGDSATRVRILNNKGGVTFS